jgi:hypothetical protein
LHDEHWRALSDRTGVAEPPAQATRPDADHIENVSAVGSDQAEED